MLTCSKKKLFISKLHVHPVSLEPTISSSTLLLQRKDVLFDLKLIGITKLFLLQLLQKWHWQPSDKRVWMSRFKSSHI